MVEWEDAWFNTNGYYTIANIHHTAPKILRHVGYLIRDDDTGLYLAAEFDVEDHDYRRTQHIPRAMVRKVTQLRTDELTKTISDCLNRISLSSLNQ